MKRTYFFCCELATGEWVNIVYESAHRKNTSNHIFDLHSIVYHRGIKLADMITGDSRRSIYLLNGRNRDEQCFDGYKVIDLRN